MPNNLGPITMVIDNANLLELIAEFVSTTLPKDFEVSGIQLVCQKGQRDEVSHFAKVTMKLKEGTP